MHAFDVLGDPVRRRVLELLAEGESTAGTITEAIRGEFGISQPAVSQHLGVLRSGGFVHVRVDGPRRIYSLDPTPLRAVDAWLDRFRRFWEQHLDALATEITRGKRDRRRTAAVDRTSDTGGPQGATCVRSSPGGRDGPPGGPSRPGDA